MQCLTPPVIGQTAISLVRLPLIVMVRAETPLDPREGRIPPVQGMVPPHPEEAVTLPQDRAMAHITADLLRHTTESVTDTTARRAHPHTDPTVMPATHIIATMVMIGDGKSDIGSGGIGYLDIGLL